MMTIEEIAKGLKENGYIPNDDICYAVFEALSLQKPILIEGDRASVRHHWRLLFPKCSACRFCACRCMTD